MLDISDRATQARELRSFSSTTNYEVRASDDGKFTFDGIASMVDTPYEVRDTFGEFAETMAPGAFNRTLKQRDDVRLLVNHEGVALARTKSNTLQLSASPHLRAVAELDPSNPDVQRIASAMSRGDLDQMSIGFRVKDQVWSKDYSERTIKEIQLFDVSVVTYPASPTTTANLRTISELLSQFPADGDYDEDELRRAIAHIEALLPTHVQPDPLIAARDAADLLRLELKIAARPAPLPY